MKKILVLKCGALGDLVYATSVVDALILEYGKDIQIDFVCSPIGNQLLSQDSRIHQVFILRHKKIPILFSAQKKAIIKYSQTNPYDVLISLEFGKQFHGLIEKISAQKKIGMGLTHILPPNTPCNRALEIKEYIKEIINTNNLNQAVPKLLPKPQTLPILPSEFLIIAPSNSHNKRSGINYRAWDFTKWQELIAILSKTHTLVILGAKGEEEFFAHIQPYPHNVIDLVGKLNVAQLVEVCRLAKATVCTDSAIGHICAATNTPIFVLMGPNNPITDAPYQTQENLVKPISLGLDCSPCYKTQTMKNCTANICMQNISVELVLKNMQEANIIQSTEANVF